MVPKGWEILSIGDLGDVITGSTPKTSDLSLYGGDIPFVGPADLGRGKPITSAIKTLSDEGFQATRKIRKGATLFTCIGSTIGKIGFSGTALATNQQINAVVPNKLHDDNFIYHALKYRASHIAKLAGTQAVPIINKSTFSSQPILVSPLPEQKKIAQILSTWDQAITATERLLENSQQRKKGLMQKLLTGKKRLPGFEGVFKILPLREAAHITMGTSPKSSAYNSSGLGLPLLQGNADIENRRSKPRVFTSEITKRCQDGNILLSVRAPVGSVAISNHEACIGRGICAIEAKAGNHQTFLYQWMLWYEPQWASLSQGSTFESVNSADIKNLQIKLPTADEQAATAQVLSAGDQEIALLHERLSCLKKEKKALMQQLLTGKRRVKVEAE